MSRKVSDYPELMLDWDSSLNNDLNPNYINDGSHIEVVWKCHKCGRQWKAPVNRRTKLGTGCTCDAMERKTKSLQKSLVEKKGSLAQNRPDIAKQWHPTKNGILTPNDITCGTEYKAWWIDEDGHEWQSAVNVRCRKSRVQGIPSNKLIVGKNDLATVNPLLVSEWDYEKNDYLVPCDVMPYSEKKIWWVCHKGHRWQASVSSRSAGRGCPECNKERNTSFPEQAIFYYAKIMFPDAESRYKTEENDEIDVFLPCVRIGIEFDGKYYHQSSKKQAMDSHKNERLKQLDIRLIRVVERSSTVPENTEFLIKYDAIPNGIKSYDSVLRSLFDLVATLSDSINSVDIDVERDAVQIWEQYIINEKENSLITKRPELIDEWNSEKNGSLKPEYISYASNKSVWWKCKKCGYEWKAPPSRRVRGSNCPVCSGRIVVKGRNDLMTSFPNVAKSWNENKNGDSKPDIYFAGSGKIVWWKCDKCGYEWKTSIANRVRSLGCPVCSGQSLSYSSSLAAKFPDIASQWLSEKNDIGPDNVFPSSEKKIWWRCDKGHMWRATVLARTHGNNCPYCGNRKILSGFNDLKSANPSFLSEWVYSKNSTTPDKVFTKSTKKVWWRCAHGHEYEASPYYRWIGEGCPYCAGKKPVVGVNDFLSTNPALAIEWDYGRNGDLTPNSVKAGSNKKVWWKCKKCGRQWQATIWSRTQGRGCPYCSGKKAIVGLNDICTTHPQLIEEWNYSKNQDAPETKTHGSRYRAWWKCKLCGFEWQTTISTRCSGSGCPKCAGKRSIGDKDVYKEVENGR